MYNSYNFIYINYDSKCYARLNNKTNIIYSCPKRKANKQKRKLRQLF